LDADALEEGGLGCVLLRVEDAGATVDIDALVGLLPLAVNEMHVDLGFTLVTLELDGLDEHFNGADTEDSASQANEFVDQVTLNHGEREHLVEVSETSLYG
jgi:hypothetical protein